MQKIKIAVTEKNDLLRASLVEHLSQESEFKIIFDSSGGMELFDKLSTLDVDVLILSSSLIGYNILQAIKVIHESEQVHNMKIIIYSNYTDDLIVPDFITYGANAVHNKTTEMEEIIRSIKTVIKEPYFFNRYLTKEMVDKLNN